MDINGIKIEEIVRQVLNSMDGQAERAGGAENSGAAAPGAIPRTARVAMLTALEHYDVKEFPMPEVGDGDILVKVEGCGICGTDAHEFKRDPFGLIPVALGHEGTGEIVKMGKDVKTDSAGKPLKVGDKVNVERSMMMNGRLDGHIVQGHVDGTAVCKEKKDAQGSTYYTFEYEFDKEMASRGYFTVDKGSVTVNGVSLTVCNPTANSFSVAIIPYTHDNTNFCDIEVGSVVNIEFDILGKYIARLNALTK